MARFLGKLRRLSLYKVSSFLTALLLCLVPTHSQELRRVLVSKSFKTEEEALDFMLKHSIPVISLEAPGDRETFKKKLRLWNPQIKDWRKIDGWEPINVYRKSPIWDISVGFHTYDNEENLANNEGTILTTNSGPTLDLRMTFVHDLEFFSYLNYKFLQKNDFQLEGQTRLYSFPANHSFEYGWMWRSSFSHWGPSLAVGWEQFSFISFNNDRFRVRRIIERNLQVSTSEIYWAIASLDFRFTLFKRGSYLRLSAGQSLHGKKSLDDGAKEENVSSTKGLISWKQYLKSRWWIQGYGQYAILKGDTETYQTQLGFYIGYSF